MQADWEFDLGQDSPWIDAAWTGFIDLRSNPQDVNQITECRQLAGLADVLLRLNAYSSPVWTAKCDVWRIDSFDWDELDAPRELTTTGVACYVDLLPKKEKGWQSPKSMEEVCRALCMGLHAVTQRCCRADFVVRSAALEAQEHTLGITVYVVGCGSSDREAEAQLACALALVVDAILQGKSTDSGDSPLQ